MAIKTLNSVGGFSVTNNDGSIATVIDNNGNITTPNLTVTGLSQLGPNSNVKITGGSFNEVLTTDGTGNLSWKAIGGTSGYLPVVTRTGVINISIVSGVLTVVGRSGNVPIVIA